MIKINKVYGDVIEAGATKTVNQYFYDGRKVEDAGNNNNNDLHTTTRHGESTDAPKAKKAKTQKKAERPRQTMTLRRRGNVTEAHLLLLYMALTKEQWIAGNDADFKALFSGRHDEDCQLVWLGKYGKSTLVTLFRQMIEAQLAEVPSGFTLPAILEGHFQDTNGQWLTGLDKGDAANDKALPVIRECIRQMKTDPSRLLDSDGDDDFRSEYDRFDQQDLHWHRR